MRGEIGLLALVSLYADSVVPTAATIPLLSFLVSHVLPGDAPKHLNGVDEPARKFAVVIDDFQKATITHASGIPGRTLWDLFLKKLWEINSLDALHVFFDALSLLLVKTREERQKDAENGVVQASDKVLLSWTSPLGAFVKRAQLKFTRLQFHDRITLWKAFVTYREPTLGMWKRRNPAAGKTSFDTNLQDDNLPMMGRLIDVVYGDLTDGERQEADVSTDDVERILEFQLNEMQKMGTRLSEDMKSQFKNMIQAGVTVPSLNHYVKFLDSWRAGDYPSSFDNLHRYFDYTMHNRDRTFYQYALLNLAILQADFGCVTEALDAVHETISTARENKDMECLNFSLSWLYHFGKAHPRDISQAQKTGVLGGEKEALVILKAKAKDAGMWSLLSTSLLSEAKLALTNGDSVTLAFETITKSSHLNVTYNIINVIGSQMMMQASVFARLGVTSLAWSYGEIFLQCYADQSPVEDVLNCICKSAYSLSQRGRYDEAIARMDEIDRDTLRILKHHQYWTVYSGLLKLQRQLHKDHLVAAEHLLDQLRGSSSNPEINFTLALLEIDLLTRRGDYSTAMGMLEKLSTRLNDEAADIYQRVKVMTLKARLLDKAGIPQKGFSVALRAASLAHKARLLPALWEAVGAVSRVLISLDEFEASAKLLASIMPQVLECEECDLTAHFFAYLADAHMGMAGQAKAGTPKRKEQMAKALEYLGQSFDEFSKLEDVKGQCEMLAKKATIMRFNGDMLLANDCAAQYLDIKRAAKENA
ncbi:Tetratricopeptide-like helical domain [Lasallia pustulata]|uniref:Anaphase-promoting complex subunit 5 n=1 Tax=Lasallia pustulata TaxID=136370 RepID=A0A1W5D5Z5_9LECA|nr:Tetratricopeptide-like helical domain [Lasallia pustulata]